MNEKWYKDIMVQRFQFDTYYDPTKLFILLALTEENELKKVYTINEISTYVYRYYISNVDDQINNVNVTIRNIRKYGVSDIYSVVISTIEQWCREQLNGSFYLNDKVLYLKIESYDNQTMVMTRKMALMLYKKYYKKELKPIINLEDFINIDDKDVDLFGNSIFKTRALEVYQYCPLSEETNIENLRAVRILPSWKCDNPEYLCDSNNLILMERSICIDYIKGLFKFDEFGRVINQGSKLVTNKMRISLKLLSQESKKYIRLNLRKE